jgi:hypothetical protein
MQRLHVTVQVLYRLKLILGRVVMSCALLMTKDRRSLIMNA